MTSEELKSRGNAAFASQDYELAISYYTEAIAIDPLNQTLYSNRSGAYLSLQMYDKAIDDARKTIELKPDWARGHTRLAAALEAIKDWNGAEAAYLKAQQLDPTNNLIAEDLKRVRQNKKPAPSPLNPLFPPDLIDRLRMNPLIAPMFSDPSFVKMVEDITTNPQFSDKYQSDPRLILVIRALLEPLLNQDKQQTPPSPASTTEKLSGNRKEAEDEKNLGNADFRRGDYDSAMEHYNKAISIDPTNMIYYTNISSVHTKQNRFLDAIEICEKAIQIGRDHNASKDMISRAYQKIATNQSALGNIDKAIEALEMSLQEKESREIEREKERLEQILKALTKENDESYEQYQEKGIDEEKKGNVIDAIDNFTKAINNGDKNEDVFIRRADLFVKIGEFKRCLSDYESVIEMNPSAEMLRKKANCLFFMGEFEKTKEFYQKAIEADPEDMAIQEEMERAVQQINKLKTPIIIPCNEFHDAPNNSEEKCE
ncbi:TPR Domain containing protein [Histomonas meleagridis]|uniref:TPR Domain containing protein n=1 Tax=Histomonas meleagridis TaxID=135588 RepID=UPI0035593850|nr:TPR Domain containing protein [Histomonas meleagridis]KAH0799922.1 TPR Domain containing protein [Histomonas meleagridis]